MSAAVVPALAVENVAAGLVLVAAKGGEELTVLARVLVDTHSGEMLAVSTHHVGDANGAEGGVGSGEDGTQRFLFWGGHGTGIAAECDASAGDGNVGGLAANILVVQETLREGRYEEAIVSAVVIDGAKRVQCRASGAKAKAQLADKAGNNQSDGKGAERPPSAGKNDVDAVGVQSGCEAVKGDCTAKGPLDFEVWEEVAARISGVFSGGRREWTREKAQWGDRVDGVWVVGSGDKESRLAGARMENLLDAAKKCTEKAAAEFANSESPRGILVPPASPGKGLGAWNGRGGGKRMLERGAFDVADGDSDAKRMRGPDGHAGRGEAMREGPRKGAGRGGGACASGPGAAARQVRRRGKGAGRGLDVLVDAAYDARMEERRQKNRESAAAANLKRKVYVAELKSNLMAIRTRANELQAADAALRAENATLRRRLCVQTL